MLTLGSSSHPPLVSKPVLGSRSTEQMHRNKWLVLTRWRTVLSHWQSKVVHCYALSYIAPALGRHCIYIN